MYTSELSKADTVVYQISTSDLKLMAEQLQLVGNAISPAASIVVPAGTREISEPSRRYLANPEFKAALVAVHQPKLCISYNRMSAHGQPEQFYALSAEGDHAIYVLTDNQREELAILAFSDESSYANWWIDTYASQGMADYPALFDSSEQIEVLITALHCIDSYRRAYMQRMLVYQKNDVVQIEIHEFLEELKRAISSGDSRWLLPSLYQLSPHLKQTQFTILPAHFERLQALSLVDWQGDSLILTDKAKRLGGEFITSWLGSLGCQARAIIDSKTMTLSQLFIASTAFTNHLVTFTQDAQNHVAFRHYAKSDQVLSDTLKKWLISLKQTVGINHNTSSSKPQTNQSDKIRFCSQCGNQIKLGKKFCSRCGHAV